MAHIDYYLSLVSPYVYLAGRRPWDIAARHGATLAVHPVDLGALLPRTGGIALADRHESRKAYRLQELRRHAARVGLPLRLQPAFFPVNGAPAAYAVIAADRAGDGDLAGLIHALSRALWAEDRDIADDEVIRTCLAGAGFDPALADRGMLAGAETYIANLEAAVGRGVFGVPFFIADGDERFWGQDRLDDLDAFLAGMSILVR